MYQAVLIVSRISRKNHLSRCELPAFLRIPNFRIPTHRVSQVRFAKRRILRSVILASPIYLVLLTLHSAIAAQAPIPADRIPDESSVPVIEIKGALVKISQAINIPVENGGVLTEVAIGEGQLIKKGDLIGRLNDAELQIQLERALLESQIASLNSESRVDIEYARKSRDVAAAELQRSEQANLRVTNSIPLTRIEKQKLERDRTELQLEQAERDSRIAKLNFNLAQNAVAHAQSQLAKAKILAPADGMIVSLEKHVGEWIESSQTLAKMVRVDRLRIEGFLPAESARWIKIGQPVTISFQPDWIDESISGTIVFVSPEANPVNLNVQIWAEFDNRDGRFVPGIRGDIMIPPRVRQ